MNEYFYDTENNKYIKKSEMNKLKEEKFKTPQSFLKILEKETHLHKTNCFVNPKMKTKDFGGGKYIFQSNNSLLFGCDFDITEIDQFFKTKIQIRSIITITDIFQDNNDFYVSYIDGNVFLKKGNDFDIFKKYKNTIYDFYKKGSDIYVGSNQCFYKNENLIRTKSDVLCIETINDTLFFGQRDGNILVYNRDKKMSEFKSKRGIFSMNNIADTYMLVGCFNNELNLYDLRFPNKELFKYQNYKNQLNRNFNILVDKNEFIYSGQDDGVVRIWNLLKGSLVKEINFETDIYNIIQYDNEYHYQSINGLYY